MKNKNIQVKNKKGTIISIEDLLRPPIKKETKRNKKK